MSWKTTAASLDRELAAFEKRIHVLKKQRNSITPLYRLPDETVERILLLLTRQPFLTEHRSHKDDEERRIDVDWTRAMLICRRFRYAALQSSALWANCNMELESASQKSCAWFDLCCERAGSHPLSVKVYLRHIEDAFTHRLVAIFPRCRHMRITLRPLLASEQEHDDEVISYRAKTFSSLNFKAKQALEDICLSKQNDTLQSLRIIKDDHLLTTSSELWALSLNRRFLGGGPNHLAHLQLANVGLTAVPYMPSLQNLRLFHFPNDLRCHIIRDILSNTPNIVSLDLEEPILSPSHNQWRFPMNVPDLSQEAFVDLSRLTSLHLRGGVLQVTQIAQIFPAPGAEFDLQIQVSLDQNWGYRNHHAFESHMQIALPRLRHRVAQYLSAVCASRLALTCSVRPMSIPDFKAIELHLHELQDGTGSARQLSLISRIMCNAGDDTSDILRWVSSMKLYKLWELLPLLTPVEFGSTVRLTHITIFDAHFAMGTPDDGNEELLEALLSERVQVQGGPIANIVLFDASYVQPGNIADLIPAQQEVVEQRWKDHGWVSNLTWDD